MKSGNIATPVDTLEAEVKRLEEAYANAISQVDKQKLARDKEVAVNAANRAKKLAEETANKAKKPVTKKKKKSKK